MFGEGGNSSLIMFLLIIGVFYFFIIRPQMNRQKKEKKFVSNIKKGDRIVTTSGIHGKVVDLPSNGSTCILETGAGKITFERSTISLELSSQYISDETSK